MNDPTEEGGGPAGVVDALVEVANENALFVLLLGVEGGLEEYWYPGILMVGLCPDKGVVFLAPCAKFF